MSEERNKILKGELMKRKNYVDGYGKTWKYDYIPEYIKELNSNPIGINNDINEYWSARELKIKNDEFKIDILYEIKEGGVYRRFTNDLKYGDRQEIIFDNKNQCYTIKHLDKLRAEWRIVHPKGKVIENMFEMFKEVEE